MQILTLDEAKLFWSDPSQQVMGLNIDELPEPGETTGITYASDGPLAVLLHKSFWPDIWMFHIGVKPEGWGKLRDHAEQLIRDVFVYTGAIRLTTWVHEPNRATVAMARRHKFDLDGRMPAVGGDVLMFGVPRDRYIEQIA